MSLDGIGEVGERASEEQGIGMYGAGFAVEPLEGIDLLTRW